MALQLAGPSGAVTSAYQLIPPLDSRAREDAKVSADAAGALPSEGSPGHAQTRSPTLHLLCPARGRDTSASPRVKFSNTHPKSEESRGRLGKKKGESSPERKRGVSTPLSCRYRQVGENASAALLSVL